MSLSALLTKPVTLRYETATGEDEYGQPITSTTEVQASCYPQAVSSLIDGVLVRSTEKWRITLPPDTPTDGLVAVVLDGELFTLASVPSRQWNPRTGDSEYVQAEIRRAAS